MLLALVGRAMKRLDLRAAGWGRGVAVQEDARILDRASPRLAEVRDARRANGAQLRESMAQWASSLHQQGVCERAQVCDPPAALLWTNRVHALQYVSR